MARSDLIIDLIKAAISSDKNKIVQVGEAIIAEERRHKHYIFADRLTTIIRENGAAPNRMGRMLQNGIASLVHEIVPGSKNVRFVFEQ